MSDHVYKTIELVGSSSRGMEDAVQKAIGKAAETVRKSLRTSASERSLFS